MSHVQGLRSKHNIHLVAGLMSACLALLVAQPSYAQSGSDIIHQGLTSIDRQLRAEERARKRQQDKEMREARKAQRDRPPQESPEQGPGQADAQAANVPASGTLAGSAAVSPVALPEGLVGRPVLLSSAKFSLVMRSEQWCAESIIADIFPNPSVSESGFNAHRSAYHAFIRAVGEELVIRCPEFRTLGIATYQPQDGYVGYLKYQHIPDKGRIRTAPHYQPEPNYSGKIYERIGNEAMANAVNGNEKWKAIPAAVAAAARAGYRHPVPGADDRDIIDVIVDTINVLDKTMNVVYAKGSTRIKGTLPTGTGDDRQVTASIRSVDKITNQTYSDDVNVTFVNNRVVCVSVVGSDGGCNQTYAKLSGTLEDRRLSKADESCLKPKFVEERVWVEHVITPAECDQGMVRQMNLPESCKGKYVTRSIERLYNTCNRTIELLCIDPLFGRNAFTLTPGMFAQDCKNRERNWKK